MKPSQVRSTWHPFPSGRRAGRMLTTISPGNLHFAMGSRPRQFGQTMSCTALQPHNLCAGDKRNAIARRASSPASAGPACASLPTHTGCFKFQASSSRHLSSLSLSTPAPNALQTNFYSLQRYRILCLCNSIVARIPQTLRKTHSRSDFRRRREELNARSSVKFPAGSILYEGVCGVGSGVGGLERP